MSRPPGRIIEKYPVTIDGITVTVPIRILAGFPCTEFTAVLPDRDMDLKNTSIDELKKSAVTLLKELHNITWSIWMLIEWTGDCVHEEGTELDEVALKFKVEFVAITDLPNDKHLWTRIPNGSVNSQGVWSGTRIANLSPQEDLPETLYKEKTAYWRDVTTTALIKATPENIAAVNALYSAVVTLSNKIHAFLKPDLAEANLLSIPVERLLGYEPSPKKKKRAKKTRRK